MPGAGVVGWRSYSASVLLRGPFALYDVRDVEAFAERAIQRSGLTEFGYLDREDLLSECITFLWELSADFDQERASFSTFAGGRLSRFIVDWKRSEYRTRWTFKDRIYERERPRLVELDQDLRAVTPEPGDPASDSGADRERIELERGGQRAGDLALIRAFLYPRIAA